MWGINVFLLFCNCTHIEIPVVEMPESLRGFDGRVTETEHSRELHQATDHRFVPKNTDLDHFMKH